MFLVTGATGNVGGELVRALVDGGHPVRGLVRASSRGALPAGAERVAGDLDRPDSLRAALPGVRGVFLLSGYQDMPAALSEMRRAGVERVVLLSSSSVPSGDMSNAVARYHILAEAAVRESGIAWTMLHPRSFMSNALEWVLQLRAGDVVRGAFPDVRLAVIDPFDVAAVAARALLSDGHQGRTYALTGPESLLPADRVRVLGRVLRRDLRFEGQTNAEAREEMSKKMPAPYVEAFFSFFVDGKLDESQVLPTVEEVTGRPPRTFEQWAIAHAAALR